MGAPTSTKHAYTPAGVASMATAVTLWGIGVVMIKEISSPFMTISVYRHFVAVPVLVIAWRLGKDKRLPIAAGSVGGILFGLHQIAHLSSLKYSTAAVVTVLFALQPILVGAFGGRTTGDYATKRFFIWSSFAIAGCALLIFASAGQPESKPIGTLLAVLNLTIWSAYYLATKRSRAEYSSIPWLLVMTVVSGLLVSTVTLVSGEPFLAQGTKNIVLLVLLALGPGTLGHFFMTWAQPRVHVAASSTMNLGVPIIASLGAAVFLGEEFGPLHILGTVIALGGSYVAMRSLEAPAAEEVVETFPEVAT